MPLSNVVTTILLMGHGLLAVLLLGALTHQCIAILATAGTPTRTGFFSSLRRVRSEVYTIE
jgi:hypothetical protein